MSLGNAWWREIWRKHGTEEMEPNGVKAPGPIAAAFLLAAVLFLVLSPNVREGFGTVLSAWNPWSYSSYEQTLRTVGRKAEARGDARTLAFVSLAIEPSQESARWADRAVALDPSLTWIYVRVLDQRYEAVLGQQAREWAIRLEQWDPENADPYLVEAQLRSHPYFRRAAYPNRSDEIPGLSDRVEHDAVWLAAMEKAFAAPRYDSYIDRWMALSRTVLDANGLRQPKFVAYGGFFYPFGVGTGRQFSVWLLDQAVEAQSRGDTVSASRNAWKVVQFAERVRVHSQTDAERMTMAGVLRRAYAVLAPIEAAAGHENTARLLADEGAIFERQLAGSRGMSLPQFYPSVNANALALHAGAAGAAISAATILLCFVGLLLARLEMISRGGRLYRWACRGTRFAPAGLLAAVIALVLSYQPYAQALQEYFSGAASNSTALRNVSGPLWAPFLVPQSMIGLLFGPTHIVYFWAGLLGTSIVAGTLVLCRQAFRRTAKAA